MRCSINEKSKLTDVLSPDVLLPNMMRVCKFLNIGTKQCILIPLSFSIQNIFLNFMLLDVSKPYIEMSIK